MALVSGAIQGVPRDGTLIQTILLVKVLFGRTILSG